jgi:D-glycero-D-manno-heptose 1,7-bisphosphate phosphatase
MDTPNPRRRAAFLDRDGVLNRKMPEGHYVTTPEEFELLPGAIPGLQMLAAKGYLLIVVTNQRGVARGKLTLDDLSVIHRKMESLLGENGLALAAIYFCPHDKDECDCRKPKPGMLRRAFESFPDISVGESVLFGDSDSDVEAAGRVGLPAFRMPANGSLEAAVQTWLSTRAACNDRD